MKSNFNDKINRGDTAADQPLVLSRGKLVLSKNKPYIPAGVVAKEFSYALSHVSLLARQKKIDAVHMDKRWYVNRESVLEHRKQAEQNKVAGGLKSQGLVLSSSSAGDDDAVLSSSTEEHLSKRANLISRTARIIAGGLLIFMLALLPLDKLPDTRAGLIDAIKNLFTTPELEIYLTTDQYDLLITRIRNLESKLSLPSTSPEPVAEEVVRTETKTETKVIETKVIREIVSGPSNTVVAQMQDRLNLFETRLGDVERLRPAIVMPPYYGTDSPKLALGSDSLTTNTLTVLNDTSLKTLSVSGNSTFNTVTVNGLLSANGNIGIGTSSAPTQLTVVGSGSFTGRLDLSRSPIAPHTGTWPSFTNLTDATIYMNPTSPVADGNIIVYANNGSSKFVVDTEGDVFARNLVLTGSTTTGTTTVAGDFNVEGNSRFGDAVGDSIKFVGTVLPNTLTSNIFTIQASPSWTGDYYTRWNNSSGTAIAVIASTGNVGIGTTNPAAKLNVVETAAVPAVIVKGGQSGANIQRWVDTNGDRVAALLNTGGLAIGVGATDNYPLNIANMAGTDFIGLAPRAMARFVSNTNKGLYLGYDNNENLGLIAPSDLSTPNGISFWSHNGTAWGERMRIHTTGNVGIGTTVPDNKLHIFAADSGGSSDTASLLTIENAGSPTLQFLGSAAGTQQIRFGDSGDNGAGVISYNHSTNQFSVRVNGSNTAGIDINSSGNVGIGTTNVDAKLEVAGTASISNSLYVLSGGNVGIGATNNDEKLRVNGNIVGSGYIGISGGQLTMTAGCLSYGSACTSGVGRIEFSSGGAALNYVSTNPDAVGPAHKFNTTTAPTTQPLFQVQNVGQPKFTIASSGNVGINTTSPATVLDVKGTSSFDPFNVASASGTSILRITKGGNVGIGTTGPGSLLHMYGSSADKIKFQLENTHATSKKAEIVFKNNAVSGGWAIFSDYISDGSDNFGIWGGGSGDARLFINSSGNIGLGTTSPTGRLDIGPTYNTGGTVQIHPTGSVATSIVLERGTATANTDWRIQNDSGGDFSISPGYDATTNNAFRAAALTILQSNSNVGIGTTNPGAALDVGGNLIFASGSWQMEAGGNLTTAAGNDLNLRVPETRSLFIKLGSSTKVTMDNQGNVGIGTTGPTAFLHIYRASTSDAFGGLGQNPSSATGCSFNFGMGGGSFEPGSGFLNTRTCGSANSKLHFLTENSERMTIDGDSGNVGIGTTNPNAGLHVRKIGDIALIASTSIDVAASFNGGGSTAQIRLDPSGTGDTGFWDLNGRVDRFSIEEDDSEKFTILSNGNVGIGTTIPRGPLTIINATGGTSARSEFVSGALSTDTPQSVLTISDTTNINNLLGAKVGTNTTDQQFVFKVSYDSNTSKKGNVQVLDAGTIDIYLNTAGDSYFNTGSNVGIGTTVPSNQLHVTATSGITNSSVGVIASPASLCYNTSTGQFGACTSDERLKDNIATIASSGLDVMKQLRPVNFTWKGGPDNMQSGFIAQEVMSVIPSAVYKTDNEYLGFKSEQILPFAVKAIQELDAKVKKLESEKPVMKKVSLENGPIKAGDRLKVSSVPGTAAKATDAGMTIGVAMESLYSISSGSYGEILVMPNESFWAPSYLAEVQMTDEQLGINDPTYNIDGLFASIVSKFGEQFGIIFEKGLIRVAKIITDIVETKKLVADELLLKDSQTGELWCVTIKNGDWDKVRGECTVQAPAITGPTPSPSPSSTPDLTNTASGSFEPTPKPTPVDNLEVSESPTPQSEATPTPTPEPSPTPSEGTPTSSSDSSGSPAPAEPSTTPNL